MKEVVLIGNPNTGKTTLFNTFTKSNERASNWHGVTVGVRSKVSKIFKENILVTDLPGIYSLGGYFSEEKIAIKYLMEHPESIVINIVDANNIYRNLKLTLELLNLGLNVVVAVNMSKESKLLNYEKLSKDLGVVIIEIDARNKKDVANLVKHVNLIKDKKPQKTTITKQNYIKIYDIMQKYCTKHNKNPYKLSDSFDKILLNKFIFPVVFLLLMFLIFYLTFGGLGTAVSNIFIHILNKIFNILRKIINCTNINNVIKIFICNGVLGTIESVFSFIPQILIMLFLLNILEDVGLMSRVAFMFDGVMKKIGLNGKALFSLFLGYGCTTTAVLTTRNLENTRLRKRTVLLLPFSSCSAKLPVFLVLSSLFFEKYKYLFVFGLYIFSVFVSILVALFFNRFDNDYENVFLLEMPKLRVPGLKKTFFDSMKVLKEFVLKVGVLILFFGSTVWLLQNISTSFKFLNGKNFEMSLLYKFSELISPIFKFVGIENVGVVASLLLGLIAKEMIIVGFAMMNGVGGSLANLTTSLLSSTAICNFTLTSSIVFLIFVLLYSPCFSALATIKGEMGLKTALIVFAFQFMIAYFVSFIVYRFILNPNWVLLLICVIVLDILFVLVLKSKKKKYCRGNCNACRKI